MSPLPPALAALALLAAMPDVRAADLLVDCTAFRTRWSAASQATEAGRPALAFERVARPAGTERVANAPGVAATLTCSEAKITHVELRESEAPAAGAPDPFAALASAALVALQGGEIDAAAAGRLLAALRAEADRGRPATSEWGAYEINLTAGAGRRAAFVIDHPEN